MTEKHKITKELLNITLSQDFAVVKEIIDKKDYKDIIKEIVQDFPLLFRADISYNKISFRAYKDIRDNKIERNLNLALSSISFYTDRIYSADNSTNHPLLKAIEAPKNYLCSSLLDNKELYDFIGKPQLSAYSKTIKILIERNGKYLNDKEYNIEEFPLIIRNLIEIFEDWYSNNIDNIKGDKKEVVIDNSTQQVLFPYEDSYISISPAHSLGMVAKVIKTNQEITFDKNKDKNSFIRQTTWSAMVGKVQNISLNAPASKKGIFLANAPSYNISYVKELLFNEDLNKFIEKELNYLVYRSPIFKNMIISFYSFLDKLIENNDLIVSKTMIKQDEKISAIFNFFRKQKNNEERYKTLDIKEFVSVFIDNIFNLKVDRFPEGVNLYYKVLDTFFDLLYLQYEKEIADNGR